jgi:hypothetical protein
MALFQKTARTTWVRTPSGLPPNTTTRLPLPDIRLSGHRRSQADRRRVLGQSRAIRKAFGRLGIVGPNR